MRLTSASSRPKAWSARWLPTRPFSPVSTTSLSRNFGYMNMSTPDAVAWIQRSFGAASNSHSGTMPRMTCASAASGTPSRSRSTMFTTAPGPAASRMAASSSGLTSGSVSVLVTSTLSGPSGTSRTVALGRPELISSCSYLSHVPVGAPALPVPPASRVAENRCPGRSCDHRLDRADAAVAGHPALAGLDTKAGVGAGDHALVRLER